jgi:hypothetical protein
MFNFFKRNNTDSASSESCETDCSKYRADVEKIEKYRTEIEKLNEAVKEQEETKRFRNSK